MEYGFTARQQTNTSIYYHHVWPVRSAIAGYLYVSPASKDFGSVAAPGTSAVRTFTISNIGTVAVPVTDISLIGGDSDMFTLDKGDGSGGTCGDTPTIAPQGSCTVTAAFTPQRVGVKTTTLRISSNAYNMPYTDIALSGNTHEPVSWWQAENNADDSAGSNHGTAGSTAYAPGKDGQAFGFDGSSAQWVSVPHSPSLDLYGSHTAMFWVRPDALPPSGKAFFLINKLTNGAEDKLVAVDSSGKVYYFLYGTTGACALSATALVPGAWTHVTVTYDAYDGGTLKIYINGVLDSNTPAIGDVGDGSGALYLGYNPERAAEGSQVYFNGLLDEIKWFNRTLTAEEIFQCAKGIKGDINGDNSVNTDDAILALQVVSGLHPDGIRADYQASDADAGNNQKIGVEEAIYILQETAKQ